MLIFIKYIVPLNPGSELLTLLSWHYEDFQFMKQLKPYKKELLLKSIKLPESFLCSIFNNIKEHVPIFKVQ